MSNQLNELMLVEKRIRLRNAWNEFIKETTDELCKHYSFCYHDLVKDVMAHYYL